MGEMDASRPAGICCDEMRGDKKSQPALALVGNSSQTKAQNKASISVGREHAGGHAESRSLVCSM
jgi:hypothetical protein